MRFGSPCMLTGYHKMLPSDFYKTCILASLRCWKENVWAWSTV